MIIKNWRQSDPRYIRSGIVTGVFRRRPSIAGITGFVLIGLCIALFPSNPAAAQNSGSSDSESKKQELSKSPRLNYAGVSFKPSNLRDPFLNPLAKSKKADGDMEIDRGLPPPGIAGTYIAEAVLKGISIRSNGRMAIVQGSGNRAYFLREGDKLFDGYLKAIHSDSITLVRERKMRSGKIIPQEVIKRLRTP